MPFGSSFSIWMAFKGGSDKLNTYRIMTLLLTNLSNNLSILPWFNVRYNVKCNHYGLISAH